MSYLVNATWQLGNTYLNATPTNINVAGNVTYTAAQMKTGVIVHEGTTGATNATTDTAANIVASITDAQVGSGYQFIVSRNTNGNQITLVAGTNVTLLGTMVIAVGRTRSFVVYITSLSPAAVSIQTTGSAQL